MYMWSPITLGSLDAQRIQVILSFGSVYRGKRARRDVAATIFLNSQRLTSPKKNVTAHSVKEVLLTALFHLKYTVYMQRALIYGSGHE